MRCVCIALLSAVATCLLPFPTPAIAQLGHPSGCVGCPRSRLQRRLRVPSPGRRSRDRTRAEHGLPLRSDGAGAHARHRRENTRSPKGVMRWSGTLAGTTSRADRTGLRSAPPEATRRRVQIRSRVCERPNRPLDADEPVVLHSSPQTSSGRGRETLVARPWSLERRSSSTGSTTSLFLWDWRTLSFGKGFKPKYEFAGPACNRIESGIFVSSQVNRAARFPDRPHRQGGSRRTVARDGFHDAPAVSVSVCVSKFRERRTREGQAMDYQRSFEDAISRLKAEGRYRTFANLERDAAPVPDGAVAPGGPGRPRAK